MVVLNAARLQDGRRVPQSNVQLALRDGEDLFLKGFESRMSGMSLAGAAHNSARFPLVSPPGSVHTASGELWGHLGDGGYHEVSGAATLADVLEALIELGCLRKVPAEATDKPTTRLMAKKHCGTEQKKDDGQVQTVESRIVVVMLDNSPSDFPVDWQRGPDGLVRNWDANEEGRIQMSRTRRKGQPVEVVGPVLGLLSHSAQEGRSARDHLASLAGTDPLSLIELRQPRYMGRREPSMNWQLDVESRQLMMCATEPPGQTVRPLLSVESGQVACWGKGGILPRGQREAANLADAALINGLQRLRGWIHHQDGQATVAVHEARP